MDKPCVAAHLKVYAQGAFFSAPLLITLYIEISEVENQGLKDHTKMRKHLLYGLFLYFHGLYDVDFLQTRVKQYIINSMKS